MVKINPEVLLKRIFCIFAILFAATKFPRRPDKLLSSLFVR